MIFAAALLISLQAGGGCSAVTPRLTQAVRRTEAARVSTLAGRRVRPAEVSHIIADRNWRLVFATPEDAERGVFVMRRSGRNYRLVETWGGVLEPSDRGDAARWARGLPGGGVPATLANCMDRAILAGR
ncbi:MAG TPA: hypothetical protein VEY69_09970 [Lautropia sp.]|nr:hypothetical protein [Lautropia sp.]